MSKIKKKLHNVRVVAEVKTKEMLEGKVTKFGTGGAHIIFSSKYVGKEVLIIPIEK